MVTIQSPFPGMEPYLEAPGIWPDVHTRLMNIIGEQLPPLLAPKYSAELETLVVIDRLDDDPPVERPEISVTSPDVCAGAPSAVAVAAPAPVQVWVPMDAPPRLVSVYIRQWETARPRRPWSWGRHCGPPTSGRALTCVWTTTGRPSHRCQRPMPLGRLNG